MTDKTQNQATPSMSNTIDIPIHSNATLLKASIAATVIAAVVLVTAILPAEYNIDPTGIGKSLGLTKIAAAAEASLPGDKPIPSVMASADSIIINTAPSVAKIKEVRAKVAGLRQDTVEIVIPAGKGLEYKLLLNAGEHLEYDWRTDGSKLYFDFHGEPQGDKTGFYESFAITTSDQMQGTLTTPFAGAHGWYWKNKTSEPIIVTLKTKGAYLIKG